MFYQYIKEYPNGLITAVKVHFSGTNKKTINKEEKELLIANGILLENPKSINDEWGRSIRRIKSTIRDYVLCNDFNWFCTLTFKEQSHDREKVMKQINDFCNYLRRRTYKNKGFKYIIIMEQHKSGAWHAHALFNDVVSEHMIFAKKRKQYDSYNWEKWNFGFSTCEKIEDKNRVSSYILKYITKDMVFEKGRKSYFCSKGLNLPILHKDIYIDESLIDDNDVYENEMFRFVKVRGGLKL